MSHKICKFDVKNTTLLSPRTTSMCSVACVQNADTCSAFSVVNESCSLGMAPGVIRLKDSLPPELSIQIWSDEDAAPLGIFITILKLFCHKILFY